MKTPSALPKAFPACLIALASLLPPCGANSFDQFDAKFDTKRPTTYHPDGSPRLELGPHKTDQARDVVIPAWVKPAEANPTSSHAKNDTFRFRVAANIELTEPATLQAATQYLSNNSEDYRIHSDLSDLELVVITRSLLGTSYRFQQMVAGYAVKNGQIVVMVDKSQKVNQVYNAIVPVGSAESNKLASASELLISKDDAYDVAWKALGVTQTTKGALLAEPKAEIKVIEHDRKLRKVYSVELYVPRRTSRGSVRSGLWEVMVDAVTGSLVDVPREKTIRESKESEAVSFQTGTPVDRRSAFVAFEKRREVAAAAPESAPTTEVQGRGFVFDTDPVTTLMDRHLSKRSPASKFQRAYYDVPLKDLKKRGDTITLEGPFVRMDDIENPSNVPSTSVTGIWRGKRGTSAFCDVMVYYHVDKAQRYIQSLGYRGDREIKGLSIVADSDGADGADNSAFTRIGGAPKLVFGRGGVPDPEDASVILHEFAHAIHTAVNPDWFGGDSGAIGEGFGDYWAASYKYTTKHGDQFASSQVFVWDTTSGTGRRVDVENVQYDPDRKYLAHERIAKGVESDELWSTPLFQSYLALVELGVPKEEVDQIIVESMFNLGYGFTMRDLAQKIVFAAKTLFPTGRHAEVFKKNFMKLGILSSN